MRSLNCWSASTGIVLVLAAGEARFVGLTPQSVGAQSAEALPKDLHAASRNRLPPIKRDDLDERRKKAYDAAVAGGQNVVTGVEAIRLHASGENVRWASTLGRPFTELAILTNARALDQPYEWSLHEMEAVAAGLDPSIIEVVRRGRPIAGLGAKEAVIIQTGREIFATHALGSDTYARALAAFGEGHLVDIVDIMADYAATATRLTAFNQQMPPGWKQFLPLPFTLPSDIHADSRSRLPLMAGPSPNPANLYSRTLAPEGTGPQHIARHGRGLQSLEARVGRRLIALAILVTAREYDSQFEWTINEPAALQAGLDPAVIDVVRSRKPLTGVAPKESALIQFGRELFKAHYVTPETYALVAGQFAEHELVDLTGLMGQHAGNAVLLAAFDQRLPAGQKSLLPVR